MIELTGLTNTNSTTKPRSPWLIWLGLSLLISAIYGWITIDKAYEPYIIQDDARHYVYWMRRLLDPTLFPNDLIADYFQSVAPAGYTAFYWIFAQLGIDPIAIVRVLPLGLGLVTSAYCFAVSWQILPVPIAGFLSTLLLNQTLWAHDDTASATPRAFLNPLFLAFLYYLLRRSLLPCLVTIALLGLFYPQYVLYASGVLVLRLLVWQDGRLRLAQRQDYWFVGIALGVAAVVLGIFALDTSQYEPIISLEQARQMPEFYKDGRSEFFQDSAWVYWVRGDRTGIMPTQRVPITWIGLLLPVLLKFPQRFPLVQRVTGNVVVLLQLTLVAFGLFVAAHAILFKLYLPSRYTTHSLRIVLALAAGVTLTLLLDAALRWLTGQSDLRKKLGLAAIALLSVAIVLYPNVTEDFPRGNYEEGKAPELYKFLAAQPKETLVVSLTDEASFIPIFAQRSTYIAEEYAIPYHVGYYNQFRERVEETITAHYTPDLTALQTFIQESGIDFWVIAQNAFKPNWIARNPWLMQFQPAATSAIDSLKQRQRPALARLVNRCSVLEPEGLRVIDTDCILEAR